MPRLPTAVRGRFGTMPGVGVGASRLTRDCGRTDVAGCERPRGAGVARPAAVDGPSPIFASFFASFAASLAAMAFSMTSTTRSPRARNGRPCSSSHAGRCAKRSPSICRQPAPHSLSHLWLQLLHSLPHLFFLQHGSSALFEAIGIGSTYFERLFVRLELYPLLDADKMHTHSLDFAAKTFGFCFVFRQKLLSVLVIDKRAKLGLLLF